MKTIIFLDIDGVLNTYGTDNKPEVKKFAPTKVNAPWTSDPEYHFAPGNEEKYRKAQIEERLVLILNQICLSFSEEGPVQVVMSSDWRLKSSTFRWATETLAEKGFIYPITEKTPVLGGARGDEVLAWLQGPSGPKEPCKVLIIDDRTDFGSVRKYLFQTSMTSGLGVNGVATKAKRVAKVWSPPVQE